MRKAKRESMRSLQEEEEKRRMQYEVATNMSRVARPDLGEDFASGI